jgi:hypothetical protein
VLLALFQLVLQFVGDVAALELVVDIADVCIKKILEISLLDLDPLLGELNANRYILLIIYLECLL